MDMVQEELQLLKYRHNLASDLMGQWGGPQAPRALHYSRCFQTVGAHWYKEMHQRTRQRCEVTLTHILRHYNNPASTASCYSNTAVLRYC